MNISASQRRQAILDYISKSPSPVPGSCLASRFCVSRQIIVSDIALLRAKNHDIISTNRGYIVHKHQVVRIIKVVHSDEEIGDELSSIVELGATVVNVFVWHKIYGKIEAQLNMSTQRDVAEYLESLKNGRSAPLKKVTSDYHYHTITAESEEILDNVEKMLLNKGYLVEEEKTFK